MSVESIIFFVLALFVWGLSAVARWFQDQMQKRSTDGLEFEPIDWSPHPGFEEAPKGEALLPLSELQQTSPSAASDRRKIDRPKRSAIRLGLGRSQTVRQGIILMTVLGPCRAMEKPNEFIHS